MLTKSQIKFIRSLSLNKYRKQYKCFLAEGDKVVSEFINSKYTIRQLIATMPWLEGNGNLVPADVEIIPVSSQSMKKVTNLISAPDVIAIIDVLEARPFLDPRSELVLALDELQDPGNLGTIIRIADWFGINTIVAGTGTVDAFNPKVVQASMGSLARVNVVQMDLQEWLSKTQAAVCGAVLGGENIYQTALPEHGVIVIGNEGKGIDPALMPLVTHRLSIPAFGKAESLNAAVATGIICSEFRRR